MSRTKDLWMEQHEAAIERFVSGEDDHEAFTRALQKLGFSSHDIYLEIDLAIAERAEQNAYEAQSAYFQSLIVRSPCK
jgi:hypothetical protein